MPSATYRMHQKLSDGSYQAIHAETEAGVVLRPNGDTVEQTLRSCVLAEDAGDNVPGFKVDADTLGGSTKEEIIASVPVYTHPTEKVCAYVPNMSTVTGILSVENGGTGTASINEFVSNLGLYPAKPTVTTVGSTFSMRNIEWIVVHTTEDAIFACSRYILGTSIFGFDEGYGGSQVLLFCRMLEASVGLTNAPWALNSTTRGATSKLFIPPASSYEGSWNYFTSNARRQCRTPEGTNCSYWTSSLNGNTIEYITEGGTISAGGSTPDDTTHGFRPCFAFKP